MSDKPALPSKREQPRRGGGPDAVWPEGPQAPRRGDLLSDPALFDGVMARRVVAYILDGFAIGALALVAWMLLAGLSVLTFGLTWPLMAILAVLPLLYHSLTIAAMGATPGMCILDVEVRLLNGMRPDLPHAVLLTILFYATVSLTSGLVLLVALFNRRSRCLHDMLTGVVTVRRSVLHPA